MLRGNVFTTDDGSSEEEATLSIDSGKPAQTATYVSAYIQGSVGEQSPKFDELRQVFVTQEESLASAEQERQIWAEAAQEAQTLVNVIETTQRIIKKKVPTLKLVDPRNVKWSEVEQAIDQGMTYYREESLKGPKGWLRKAFRKLSDNSHAFEKWVGFLPEGTYTAPVCASFRIVLAVASSLGDIRDDVFATLADIPEIFKSAEQYLDIYDSIALRTCAAALYASLARTLQSIMKFFAENPFRKVGHALLFKEHDSPFKTNLQQMHVCKAAFRDAGELCLHKRLQEIERNMSSLQRSFLTRLDRESNSPNQTDTKAEAREMVNLCNALLATLTEDRSRLDEERLSLKREREQMLLLANSKPKTGLKPAKLLNLLSAFGFDPRSTAQELDTALLHSPSTHTATTTERLTWIRETPAFQSWLLAPTSRYLVVQSDDRDPQPLSALSTLGAEIAHILSVAKVAATACHFCGLHNRPQHERHAGGVGMLAGLLGQLVRGWDAAKRGGGQRLYVDEGLKADLRRGKLRALAEALRTTVRSLGEGRMAFMFVDSLDAFEQPALAARAARAVEYLLGIMEETCEGGGVVVKVLVTAPNQRELAEVVGGFENGEVLVVPDVTDCGMSSLDRSGILDLAVSQLADK